MIRVDQGGVVVYQYTQKKFAKIPKNTENSSKYTQNYTQVYFMPEIQRKWYTEYPYLSCNIPYTRFKKPLYTVYPKTLADPVWWGQHFWSTVTCLYPGLSFSPIILSMKYTVKLN